MLFGKHINRYYLRHAPALLFGILSLVVVDYMQLKIPELYKTLTTEFLPDPTCYPKIERVNEFMGMYIRLELLSRWGMDEQIIDEVKAFFGHMSKLTGTLWEHKQISNSLNHGFAAYLIVLLIKIYNK